MTTSPPVNWEDTNPAIAVAELRDRHREIRADVAKHDGKIETLQGQVTVLTVRVEHLRAGVAWGLSIVGSLVAAGFVAVLSKLYGGH